VYWWDDDPRENLFMEVTKRSDIGVDLKAPVAARGGGATPGYALVRAVNPGDVVVHYDSPQEQIVGASLVTGEAEPAPLMWVARGTSARRAGEQARWLAGIRVPLDNYVPVSPPVSLDDIRQHQDELLLIRDEIESRHRGAVFFPWTPYGDGPIRTWQSYLVKLPQAAVDLFPLLRVAVDAVSASQTATLDLSPEVDDAESRVADVAGKSRLRSGQGYQLDQAVKTAVEVYAMNAAIRYWSQHGEVEDVHGNESYDLRCTVAGQEKHIEVKGTTTIGDEVILTPNEVAHARTHPHLCLFVVSEILVLRHSDGQIETTGGSVWMVDPWLIDTGYLKPVGYRHGVPQIGRIPVFT
jgi:hypothetical protein